MAKLTSRPLVTSTADTSQLHIVEDPSGTPISKRITKSNFIANTAKKDVAETITEVWNFEAGFTVDPTSEPSWVFKDSDAPGVDKDIAKIYAQYIDGADGSENGDLFFQVMQDGSQTTFIQLDESDDQVEFKKVVSFEAGSKALTPVTGSTTGFTAGFTGANLYGGTYIVSSDDGDLQLPLMAEGMWFTIITLGAIEVVVDTNVADGYLMDGTTNVEGKNLTNLSTTGDIAVFQYYTADDWLITTNGWTPEA